MANFQYLVVLSHTMDEIPLRLFADRDAAFEFAKTADWYPPETMQRILELPESTTPCVIAVWAFRDDEPISRVIVRDWEDEDDGDDAMTEDPTPQVPQKA